MVDSKLVSRALLRINMDESVLPITPSGGEGTAMRTCPRNMTRHAATQHVTHQDLRIHLTLIAFVCDSTALQPLLLQIILAPRHRITVAEAREITEAFPTIFRCAPYKRVA